MRAQSAQIIIQPPAIFPMTRTPRSTKSSLKLKPMQRDQRRGFAATIFLKPGFPPTARIGHRAQSRLKRGLELYFFGTRIAAKIPWPEN
jgi:hypothetical protein